MTKFFKSKKQASKKPIPRTMAEINKEYSELVSKAGQAQYQIFIFKQEIDRLNSLIAQLNYEAADRSKLDQEEQDDTKEQAAEVVNE